MADQAYHKPYFAEGTEAMLALEAMVDRAGLANVIYALAHIANAKADHLASNWQDRSSAKAWEHDAQLLDNAASCFWG
jgi:hypothetical protein